MSMCVSTNLNIYFHLHKQVKKKKNLILFKIFIKFKND